MIESLKESDRDFELYHQFRDEAFLKQNEWTKKKCKLCLVKHTPFVCPQLHYIPLRSVVFLRFQTGSGQIQRRNNFGFKRQKARLSKAFCLKLWKRIF